MSMLDIDERILQLAEIAEFDRSPLTDQKHCENCDIGLIEGGVCNAENAEVLREFRDRCKILVAVGACAINGGIPAMRNHIDMESCLVEAYIDGIGITDPQIPNDPELPLLLDKVYPIHEVVKIDYSLPGCPPSADVFWQFLSDFIEGREPQIPQDLIRFD